MIRNCYSLKEFNLKIYCPELAFVKFTIKDELTTYGEYTIRYINMRQGKRYFSNYNFYYKKPYHFLN